MPGRTVSVTLTAVTAGFNAAIGKSAAAAEAAAARIQSSMGKALDGIDKQSARIDSIGSSLGKMGIAGAAGLALTAKAAMDWESAWAGVTKTVDGSASQMAELEGQLRNMAKTLPASHEEIAAVAEAAGQLGVQRENVASFTRTMIDLGETTNLSADEAATSLAQMMNIMGTAPENVGRLGATIVALGNAGASTERDIVQMSQRIAGAGAQVGLSETQVLAFSNALASVGIDAEAGGTAISTTFLRIDSAVRAGGKSLDLLAQTAGVSAADFGKAFRTDAAGALNSFVVGLGKVQQQGGDTTQILSDLGITGIREADALRRLASSGTLLADSLKLGNQAWKDNSALVEEAAKRYATTEAQAKIAWNQIKDAAISGGQAMLPIISQVATVIGKIAEAFGSMPGPARIAAVSLVATATAIGLFGAGTLKAITGIASLRTAFTGLAASSVAAGRAMKIAQLSIPVVGVALFAATSAMQAWAGRTSAAQTSANGFADAMQSVEGAVTRATAALNENVRLEAVRQLQSKTDPNDANKTVTSAFENAQKLGLSYSTVTDAALGQKAAQDQVNAVLQRAIGLNAQQSKGNSDQRKAAMELAGVLNLVASTSIDAIQAEKDRRAAMEGGAGATQAAGKAAEQHAQQVQQETDALNELADAAVASANALLQISGSQIGMESAIDAATKAAKDNGTTLDINTAKGRANKQALDALASATVQLTSGMIKNGESAEAVVTANERGRSSFVKSAVAMGMTKKAAGQLAESLFLIPGEVRSQVVVAGGEISKKQAKDLNKELRTIPKEQRAKIVTIAETKGAKAAKQAMAEVKSKEVIAKATGKGVDTVKEIDGALKKLKSKEVRAQAKAAGKDAVSALDGAIKKLESKKVKVSADTSGKSSVDAMAGAIARVQSKTVVVTTQTRKMTVATGGLVTPAGVLYRSDGGPVWGAGTATSDSIPAMLSNGEYVIKAASAMKLGIDRLQHMNQTGTLPGFARGGVVGAATGLGVDQALILRLIAQLQNPLAAITAAARALGLARSVKTREDRETKTALAAYRRAIATDKRVNSKGSERAKDKAEAAYKKQLDQQKDANAKLVETTRALSDANNAAADAARSMSDQFANAFRSGSVDPKDWLESMLGGSKELSAFTAQIGQLRKAGLAESLIQQILEQGSGTGAETAANILAGGKGLISQLNSANQSLEKAADALGYLGTTSPQRKADGGYVSGAGTGTSDSISARLSNGEYVINAAATAAHRPLLDQINYGRRVVAPARFAQTHYARGGYVNTGGVSIDSGAIAEAVQAGMQGMTITATLDGQPFEARITSAFRDRGNAGRRTR